MPRVLWAEESKAGLEFETESSYDDVPMTSQCATVWQSSCTNTKGERKRSSEGKDRTLHACCTSFVFVLSLLLRGWIFFGRIQHGQLPLDHLLPARLFVSCRRCCSRLLLLLYLCLFLPFLLHINTKRKW